MKYADYVILEKNFDFDKTAMAFVSKFIDPFYGDASRETNRTLRSYMKESSFGEIHNVAYNLICKIEAGKVLHLGEYADICVRDSVVLNLAISKVPAIELITEGFVENTPEYILGTIDGAFSKHTDLNGIDHLSRLSSLRPLIRDILSKSVKSFSNEGEFITSWVFLMDDNDGYYNAIGLSVNNEEHAETTDDQQS